MADDLEDFYRSFTEEVRATIGRIDSLIGRAHWPSVGNYKEGVIRRQLVDCVPDRFSVGVLVQPEQENECRCLKHSGRRMNAF